MLDYTYRLSKVWAKNTGKFAKMSLVGGGGTFPLLLHTHVNQTVREKIFFFKWAATSQISNLIARWGVFHMSRIIYVTTLKLCFHFLAIFSFFLLLKYLFFASSFCGASKDCTLILSGPAWDIEFEPGTDLRVNHGSVRQTLPKNNRSVGLKIKPVMAAVQGWMQL